MAEEPDRLRQEIEQTRASLTRDVDLLTEKTSPRQVARRRWTAVKEKVMGTSEHGAHAAAGMVQDTRAQLGDKASQLGDKASELGDRASEKAHDVAGAVKGAPQAVTRQTQGNPLAAGIIAFGVGMLAATLIPVTEAEKQAGEQLREHGGELTDRVKEAATELKDDVTGTVQQAAGQLKETARDAAETTREQARSSAQDAKDQSKQAVADARS
ncbi:DUF3618 domain-containing protein [Couchioplanes caeruleus]|uniref:DUF3618 domain-containing protein n=2 Tax=Couchioplanes caeruleus TaxID=56438 RepID=A0A1K0GL31_9ACTN|nr:DUF3618 domain-containing protein [Couchioplanes caeruleus]OJF09899.1 hypothetical protein BG844_35160 [Couchioplanes caeruleus subsp. caeruleus]ROP27681.1 uncharacterized protein DUF3618 [Couchioplanes caeruleus]